MGGDAAARYPGTNPMVVVRPTRKLLTILLSFCAQSGKRTDRCTV